jgi:hypothetical protein
MTETRTERKNRTSKQNAYLWAVPYRIIAGALARNGVRCKSGRITEDDVHEWAKENILKEVLEDERAENGGDCSNRVAMLGMFRLRRRPSTSILTTEQFQKYILALQAHFAPYDVDIPEPGEDELTAAYGPKIKRVL